jgi:hypothetical protein
MLIPLSLKNGPHLSNSNTVNIMLPRDTAARQRRQRAKLHHHRLRPLLDLLYLSYTLSCCFLVLHLMRVRPPASLADSTISVMTRARIPNSACCEFILFNI